MMVAGSGNGSALASGTTPVLETLRQATRQLHRQTERALDLPRAASSRTEYIRLLQRMLGFYAPLEQQLLAGGGDAGDNPIDWQARRKAPLLRLDLDRLQPGSLDHVAMCPYVPELHTAPQRAGGWYVVEGATLGGRVISAHLADRLGVQAATGARFFDAYGEQREPRWEEFCGWLQRMPVADSDGVAAGAVAVFEAMRRWLVSRHAAPAAHP